MEYVMLKIVSVCAALVLAAATFSTSAVARQGHGGKSFGGGHGGKSFGGGPGKMNFGGGPGKMSFGGGPGKMGYGGPGKMGYAGPGKMGYAGPGKMGYGPKYGQWQGKGNWSGGKQYGNQHAYWYGGRRHYGYWPWAVGAGLAVAATGAYYGGYDYGYDDCVQWRPDWGWVNVCEYPYGGYYPY
jgi:hypothetical protein